MAGNNEMRKKQEKQLIESAKAFFEKYALTDALDKFFARTDVRRKMQGAYNQFERYLGYFQESVEKSDSPAELKARACEIAKSMSGNKDLMDATIKNMTLCAMYGTFSSMGAWVHLDDKVMRPFTDAMTIEKGDQIIYTFEDMCESAVLTMWDDTLGKVVENLKKEEGVEILLGVVKQLDNNLG